MKTYYLSFGGSGDPRQFAGLAPTFLIFNNAGAAVTPPSISAVTGATGYYMFAWGTTSPIVFLADAATTSPGTSGRYVRGSIDPADRIDEVGISLIAQGVSMLAQGLTTLGFGVSTYAGLGFQGSTLTGIGNTLSGLGISSAALAGLIGDTTSSFGSTAIDPTTVFGFLKRAQEFSEGNSTYAKTTGIMDIYSRGSSTLLSEKTISDSATQTTKT